MIADLVKMRHMLDAITEITDFTTDKKREDLDVDRKLALSLVHLLEITGEAASGVSNKMRNKYNNIPWQIIADTRNRLIHGYFDIDLDIVWKTIEKDIPALKKSLEIIIASEEEL